MSSKSPVSTSCSRLGWALCAAVLLLLPHVAHARAWEGIEPGRSTRKEVIAAFGDPVRVVEGQGPKKETTLAYLGRRHLRGTRQVQFRLNADGIVTRIDVFPEHHLEQKVIENTYGPACGQEPKEGCYVELLTATLRKYMAYAQDGLFAFIASDGGIESMVFSTPKVDLVRHAEAKNTEGPNEGGTSPHGDKSGEGDFSGSIDDPSVGGGRDTAGGSAQADIGSPTELHDTLQIGARFYAQAQGAILPKTAETPCCLPFGREFSAPTLTDVYFDGRPNDRLRAMVSARLYYDPAFDPVAANGGNVVGAPANPNIVLDELWVSFDVGHAFFVTSGRKHMKWGTGKIWNPTDFLQAPLLDPLAVVDDRPGVDMLRLELPLEKIASNLYALGVVDSKVPKGEPLRYGAAFRGEFVLGTTEFALSSVFLERRKPQYGFSFSSALGPLDITGELAVRQDVPSLPWREVENPPADAPFDARFEQYKPNQKYLPAGSGGLSVPINLGRSHELVVGTEGFYNPLGYDDPIFIAWLRYQGRYQPAAFGRYYGALYFVLSGNDPAAWRYQLTTLTNLSDYSLKTRLNITIPLWKNTLLDLTGEVPYGKRGGEFTFTGEVPDLPADQAAVASPAPYGTVAVGVRANF